MITSYIESNNPNVEQAEIIQHDCVAQAPPCAIWLQYQHKIMCSPLDNHYRDDMSGSDCQRRLKMVAFSVQKLNWRFQLLLESYHTSSPINWLRRKHLTQGKQPSNA